MFYVPGNHHIWTLKVVCIIYGVIILIGSVWVCVRTIQNAEKGRKWMGWIRGCTPRPAQSPPTWVSTINGSVPKLSFFLKLLALAKQFVAACDYLISRQWEQLLLSFHWTIFLLLSPHPIYFSSTASYPAPVRGTVTSLLLKQAALGILVHRIWL